VDGISDRNEDESDVKILDMSKHYRYVVVEKSPAVPCHHSYYVGRGGLLETTPLLQRVRDQQVLGQQVNLEHRLDRGATY
jgi:23S rRNA-/tRNA-specific pseudouridylate synthase